MVCLSKLAMGSGLAMLALLLSVSSLDCSGADQRVSALSLNRTNSGERVSISVGSEIDVTLQTIGPGSYGDPRMSGATLSFLGQSEVGPINPGGPVQLYKFRAVAPGDEDILIPHVADTTGPDTNSDFTVGITVTSAPPN
jgi:hypothetical protein